MKKLLVFVLALCLMASLLCVTAFAADEPAAGVVLRVSALQKDGETVKIEDYKSFKDGWNAAMELADNRKEMKAKEYDRIVVDLYADWNAVGGEFSNSGAGFNWDAIYFQDGVRMTLNLNGHTINRGLTVYEYNGEVMYIDEDADVIINGGKNATDTTTGTITGGFSCNGAGGIHINDNAHVTLNYVNVVGNRAEDDDGGGIAIYDGARLDMNYGSISNNSVILSDSMERLCGGGIYAEDSVVVLSYVTLQNNNGEGASNSYPAHGAAVYGDNAFISMSYCNIIGNGMENPTKKMVATYSIIHGVSDSIVVIVESTFDGNGASGARQSGMDKWDPNAVVTTDDSYIGMDKNVFTNNNQIYLLSLDNAAVDITKTSFVGNKSFAVYGYACDPDKGIISECQFGAGDAASFGFTNDFHFTKTSSNFNFTKCEFGKATFNNKGAALYDNAAVGSIFGTGSIVIVISVIALLTSVASIGVTVAYNKKKTATANASDEDEE